MATGDIVFFNEALEDALENWSGTDTLKCAVLDNTTAPTAATVTPALADFTEVGAAGTYVAGGASLGTWADFITQSAGTTKFDSATNPTWAQNASNDTDAYWGLIYNSTLAGNKALCYVELGGPVSMAAGALTITWNASGIATIS